MYLDFYEKHGVGVREGNVAERLQGVPRLGRRGDARGGADLDPQEGAACPVVRRELGGAQEQPDEGVGARHDGGDHGDDGELLQARQLGQGHLDEAERHHVRRPGRDAGRVVAPVVVAVRARDGPAIHTRGVPNKLLFSPDLKCAFVRH